MSKYRKKYHNIVEKKNHLIYVPRDNKTIEHYESHDLEDFTIQPMGPKFYIQRMGQLHIMSSGKKRYELNYYGKQARLIFPAKPKFPPHIQSQDSFLIKSIPKPINTIQKSVNFILPHKPKPKNYVEDQIDRFTCPKKPRPLYKYENVQNMNIEKLKKGYFEESLNQFKLPATGKRFTNNPVLKARENIEIEYLKIQAPFKCVNSSNLLLPLQPKKNRFAGITIENCPDIFITEQGKKRYYSVMSADNMSIIGSERPEFCLEIDPNEEIFVPNVYDMLLIQNYWDDLSIRSFRICLRPRGYVGKVTQNTLDNNNILTNNINNQIEEKKEDNQENDNDPDRDVLKEFNENVKKKEIDNVNQKGKEKEIEVNNIYEDKKGMASLRANLEAKKEEGKEKEKENGPKKGSRFKDLKKKLMMLKNED